MRQHYLPENPFFLADRGEHFRDAISACNTIMESPLLQKHRRLRSVVLSCRHDLPRDRLRAISSADNARHFGLEACIFVSLPSLSMSAAQTTSRTKLDLVTDIDQHLMWEAGIRGGICVAPEKFTTANNKYMGAAYDENKESSFILDFDCNSLDAFIMWNFKLPCGGFLFLNEQEISGEDP